MRNRTVASSTSWTNSSFWGISMIALLIALFIFRNFLLLEFDPSVYVELRIISRPSLEARDRSEYHSYVLRHLLNTQFPGLVPRGAYINRRNLRLSMIERDFNESDYEALLALDEELPTSARAATPALIAQLPSHEVTTTSPDPRLKEPCAICLDGYEPGDLVKTVVCSHLFHSKCLDKWLTVRATCPVCNFDLNA